jgi:MFS transporter, DHA1 family, multidrug resistance protein
MSAVVYVRRLRRAIRRTPFLAGLPPEVAVLSAIAFCVALGFGILAPALPVFARTFDVTIFQASAVISVFALVRFVTSPLAGALTDRLGERTVLATGLTIVAVSSAAAGFSQTYGQLLALRGIGGLGSSMFTVSAMALLLRVVHADQRGRAAAAFQGGFLFGGVAGPAVGGIVVAWSIRAPFFVYAFTLFLAIIVTLVYLTRSQLLEREQQASGDDAGKLEALRSALRNPAYRATLGVSFITGFIVFGLRASALPLFVTEGLNRGPSLAGFGLLVAAAFQALLLLPAGRMADTVGRRRALLFGTIGTTISMLVITAADVAANRLGTAAMWGTILFFASLAIGGAASAYLGSAPAAVVGDIMGGKRGGIVVATFQMMSDFGAILGPLIAGLLIDAVDFELAFAVTTVLALAAVILVVIMPETLRRSPEVPRT